MTERMSFEIEQACKALKKQGNGHLADAVGELYRDWKKQRDTIIIQETKMEKILDLIDKFYVED